LPAQFPRLSVGLATRIGILSGPRRRSVPFRTAQRPLFSESKVEFPRRDGRDRFALLGEQFDFFVSAKGRRATITLSSRQSVLSSIFSGTTWIELRRRRREADAALTSPSEGCERSLSRRCCRAGGHRRPPR